MSEKTESPGTELAEEARTGLEDVVRSLRELTRTGRTLATSSADVLERELAMAITISEDIQRSFIAPHALEELRTTGLAGRLREDAHRALDLAADTATIASLSVIRLAERFADQPRPALEPARPVTRHIAAARA
ncbi:MAG TPA: hypothetical protein VFO60_08975 [Candidatus Dormibacteraeota bacterium]|nr:hypothetical protein [Candidatus Dormibacteraeota bacterium]